MSDLDNVQDNNESIGSYIQHDPHRASFTTIYNSCINDTRLGQKELGLLLYMLSKPPTWKIRVTEVGKRFDLHVDTVSKQLKNLAELGYVRREQLRNNDGSWGGFVTYVSDIPQYAKDKPTDKQPVPVFTGPVLYGSRKTPPLSKERDFSKKETSIKKQQQQETAPVAVVFFDEGLMGAMRELEVDQQSIEWLSGKYEPAYLWEKVRLTNSKRRNNPAGWLLHAVKGDWKPGKQNNKPVQKATSSYLYHVARQISEPGDPEAVHLGEESDGYKAFLAMKRPMVRAQGITQGKSND